MDVLYTTANLPAPPGAAMDVIRACVHPDIDARGAAEIVLRDPPLAIEVLRLANSAAYSRGREVTSVSRAIARIGLRATRNVALAFALRQSVGQIQIPGLDTREFWEDAMWRGTAARTAAESLGLDTDDAFALGLIQDLGLVALIGANPITGTVWPDLRGDAPDHRLEREQNLFGTDHTEVGPALLEMWSIPDILVGAVRGHHDSTTSAPWARIAAAADWIAWSMVADDQGHALARSEAALVRLLDMSPEEAIEITLRVDEDLRAGKVPFSAT